MAWTQADVDALKAAYAQGVTSVSHNGKTVQYASLPDMWNAIRQMQEEVETGNGTVTPTNRPNRRRVRLGVNW